MTSNKKEAFYALARKYCMNPIEYLKKKDLIWSDKTLEIFKRTKSFNSEELNDLYNEYPEHDHISKPTGQIEA